MDGLTKDKKHDNDKHGDGKENTPSLRRQAFHTVLGVIAGIIILIAARRLAKLHLGKADIKTQTIGCLIAVVLSLIALFWLGTKYPKTFIDD